MQSSQYSLLKVTIQVLRMPEDQAQEVVDDPRYGPTFWETEDTLLKKKGSYDWGLLNGYWKAK